jgi:hypothetical protein
MMGFSLKSLLLGTNQIPGFTSDFKMDINNINFVQPRPLAFGGSLYQKA